MNALRVFPNRDALMRAAADRLEAALRDGLQQRGTACAALSGGSTPEPAYALLAQRKLDWRNVSLALVDERFAPPSDPASNEGMVRRAFAPAIAQGARVLPMWKDQATPAQAAYAADALYAPLHIDIALMGMGADGHTASWFPQSADLAVALDPKNPRHVITVEAIGAAGTSSRLTMTLSSIARADAALALITSEDKRARFDALAAKPDPSLPFPALSAALGARLENFWAA